MPLRKRPGSDFHSEIESHIRLEADRLIEEGMSSGDALTAARRAFGNVTQLEERFYESQRCLWFDQFLQDLRFGWRSLRKTPSFTLAAALTVALGAGANTAVFSLMDAVLLRTLPVSNPRQLVFLETAGAAGPSGAPPYPCFVRLRAETKSFTALAAFSADELRIEIAGRPEQVMGQVASGNYFDLLGVKPLLGRLLSAADENLDPPVAVISERYWRKRFGADPAVLGTPISFRNRTFLIAGVTPAEFYGLQPGSPVDITFPITLEQRLLTDSSALWLHGIVARLKPGADPTAAQAESDVIYRSFLAGTRYPADLVAKHFQRLEARSAAQGLDTLRRRFSKPLWALLGIAGLVLLLAAANIANLLLARGISRGREFAIRLAAGAGRARILRQSLTETLLLFTLGAIPGLYFANWGAHAIGMLFREGRRSITIEPNLNWHVLAFALAITLLAALGAGLLPAWRVYRTGLDQAIREGQPRTGESRRTVTLAHGIVAFQVALSLILLVVAAIFVQTLANLRHIDRGFANQDVLTMSMQLPGDNVDRRASTAAWSRVLDAVRSIPGVRSAAVSTFTPLSGRDRGALVQVRGYTPPGSEDAAIHINQVSEGYFETLGTSLLRGRMFTDRDSEASTRVALINEAAARHFFGDRDPIGEPIGLLRKGDADTYRIVGVVRDTSHIHLRETAARFAFLPIRQPRDPERRVTLLATPQFPGGESALLEPVRKAVAQADPGILISDVITLRRQIDSTLLTERLLSGLSAAFGFLAILLASIGLYGVLSYRISRQSQSIGIRMALGATPSSIARSVLRQCALVLAVGLLAGLPFAYAAARLANAMLWGIEAGNPLIYLACAGLLSLCAIASAWLPARRASAIEPAAALRHG